MPSASASLLTIVADDLTGACDTGTLFAGRAPVPATVWPRIARDAAIRVVDTETRARPPREAAARVVAAAHALAAPRVFKKIDSTLRGQVGVEVDALMRAIGARSALLCPAFPAQRRVVVDRLLLVDGVPLTETAAARDPHFPAVPETTRLGTADLTELLRPQLDRALAWVPLDEVRVGVEALATRLGRLAGTVTIADAETDDDLDALVAAALACDPPPLLVGSAGLAHALAARFGVLSERVALPAFERWLLVAGSRHPVTRAQVAAAREAGLAVLATADAPHADPARPLAELAAAAREAIARGDADVVLVTGGDTALALFEALEGERLDLVGAPRPGLSFGYLRGPRHPGLPLITKSGGFGEEDLFVSLALARAA